MDASQALRPPPAVASDWALFLDVDGTLLDFAERPDAVRVPHALILVLTGLWQRLDGALALVSGRPLAQLDALFRPLALPAAGLHGLEYRIHPRLPCPPPHQSPAQSLAPLLHKARDIAQRHPGAVVEDKGVTVALHWRGNPAAEADFRTLAQAALHTLPGYRPQAGDGVIELRPCGPDKGSAIAAMLDTTQFRGRTPVFVGDDLTDEYGFEVVNGQGGLAVLVGDRVPSAAGYRLAGPTAVRAWLAAATAPPLATEHTE